MQVSRVNLVSAELFPISELKAYMRIEHDVEDTLLKSLQRAAYDWVEQFTGRSILTTQWRFLTTPLRARSEVRHALPFPNLLEIESVHHFFSETKKEKVKNFTIEPHLGIEYLCLLSKGMPVEVLYSAGFGPHPRFVPEAFRQAVKMLTAQWFENREGLGCSIPTAVEIILRPFQIRRLA